MMTEHTSVEERVWDLSHRIATAVDHERDLRLVGEALLLSTAAWCQLRAQHHDFDANRVAADYVSGLLDAVADLERAHPCWIQVDATTTH